MVFKKKFTNLKKIFPLLVIVFLSFFGFALAIPLFPPLFLNPDAYFLSPCTTIQTRQILLGILIAMYPMGQFIGAPILGKWSDKYGRKPILLFSLLFLIPAHLLSALSISYIYPSLLFISRFLAGLLGGDIVTAQAAIADFSRDSQTKTKNFGLFTVFSSIAFFLGPFLGGQFSDSEFITWFSYDTPFWCTAILSFISLILVVCLFRETHEADSSIKISVKSIALNMIDGLKRPLLKIVFTANLFIFLSIFFFFNCVSPYLIYLYAFSPSLLGFVNAYLSVPVMLAPLIFHYFNKIWSTKRTLQIGAFGLGISYVIFMLVPSPWSLFVTLIPIGFFIGMNFTFAALLVSNKANLQSQGQMLGTNQSIQVFAEALTALIGGSLMALYHTAPFYLAILCALIGALILIPQLDKIH